MVPNEPPKSMNPDTGEVTGGGLSASSLAAALVALRPAPPDPSKDPQVKVVALHEGIQVPGATVDGKPVDTLPVGKVASVSEPVFKRALAPHKGMVTTPEAHDAKKKAQAAHDKAMAEFDRAMERPDQPTKSDDDEKE